MSSLLATSDVYIVSDMSGTDSEDEIYNIDQITDRTGLLSQPQSIPVSPSSTNKQVRYDISSQTHSNVDRSEGDRFSCESGLWLHEDGIQSDALKNEQKHVFLRLMALCCMALLFAVALSLETTNLVLVTAAEWDKKYMTITLVCLYVCIAFAALLSPLVIDVMTARWSVVAGCVGVTLFLIFKCAHIWPLIITGAIIGGISSAPALIALLTSATQLATEFQQFGGVRTKAVLPIFSGLFHSLYLSGPLFGYLIVIAISTLTNFDLSETNISIHENGIRPKDVNMMPENYTFNTWSPLQYLNELQNNALDDVKRMQCGTKLCWNNFPEKNRINYWNDDRDDRKMSHRVQALLGCFVLCSVTALLLAIFCLKRPAKDYDCHDNSGESLKTKLFNFSSLCSSLSLLKQCDMLLIIPIVLYIGIQQTVGFSILTEAFTSCSLGGLHVVYTTLSLSGTCLLFSPIAGLTCAVTGRLPVVCFAAIIQTSLIITMFIEDVGSWPSWLFYLVTCLWAASDCFLQVTTTVAIGEMFITTLPSAFSQYVLWKTVGGGIIIILQIAGVCTFYHFTTSLIILVIACILYAAHEIRVSLKREEDRSKEPEDKIIRLSSNEASWLPSINPMRIREGRTQSLIAKRDVASINDDLIST